MLSPASETLQAGKPRLRVKGLLDDLIVFGVLDPGLGLHGLGDVGEPQAGRPRHPVVRHEGRDAALPQRRAAPIANQGLFLDTSFRGF